MHLLSISELEAIVLKAFRGAGYSWGVSQEAGRAAAWLALRGLPSAASFATLLQQIEGQSPESLTPAMLDGEWCRAKHPRCPVITGATLSDFGWTVGSNVIVGPVYSPMIVLPFVASCAMTADVNLSVTMGDKKLIITSDGELNIGGTELDEEPLASIGIADDDGGADRLLHGTTLCRRAPVTESQLQTFQSLAHLTYVAASDESRSGAGAGLTDND